MSPAFTAGEYTKIRRADVFMMIEINKDIEKYKETVFLGLTARQLCYSVACVVVGGGLFFLLYPYIGMDMAVYVTAPVVFPIGMNGFYDYNGLGFTEMSKRKLHYGYFNLPLRYHSTENEEIVNEILKERAEKEAADKKKARRAEAKAGKKAASLKKPEKAVGKKNKRTYAWIGGILILFAAGTAYLYFTGQLIPVIDMIKGYLAGV